MTSQGLSFDRGLAALVVLVVLALSGAAAPNAFAAAGSISGTVTGAPSHSAVAEVEACASKIENEGEISESKDHCVFSAANGNYEIANLEAGKYVVLFWPRGVGQNYVPAYYNPDATWPPDSVTVGSGATTGIDRELPEAGSIEGKVTAEVGGEPLAGVVVCATEGWEVNGEREWRCDATGADGRYLIVGLLHAEYTVEFSATKGGLHYFDERWRDQRVGNGYPQTLVPVTEGHVTSGIDAALEPSAEIRGVVTAAADDRPLNDILVCLAPPASFSEPEFDRKVHCKRTDRSGAYSIGNLEAGQYKVAFSLELREFVHWLPPLEPEEDGYPTRYWKEKDTLWEADVLTLNAPAVATAIDARLGPFPPASVVSPSPPPLPAAPRIVKQRCRPGRQLKKVKGRRRCVRPPVRKHRRRSSHLRNAHGSARAGR